MHRRQFMHAAGGAAALGAAFGLPAISTRAQAGVPFKGVDGAPVRISQAQLAALGRAIGGPIIKAGDPDYDSARRIWNARIDHYPGAILRARSSSDIAAAINFARDNGVELSVRAGGHNHAGFAVSDGGLMLDLSLMRQGTLSADRRRISVEPGQTYAEFDALTHGAGLATTGPIVSMVGLPGYTLGGGIGWLHRKFGAGCDNLTAAEVVLASGEIVRASERENEDLFWGLRGGGGNFGVASRLEYRLHPLSNVLAGLIFYPLDAAETVGDFVDGYLDQAPDDLNVWMLHRMAPRSPALPQEIHGRPVVILAITWAGDEAAGVRAVAPLRQIATPLADLVRWRSYPEWQGALDAAWGNGFNNEWVGGYLRRYDAEARETIADFVGRASSPVSDFKLARLGGEFSRAGAADTAFGFRDARYAYVIQTRWAEGEDGLRHLAWTYAFHEAMRAFDDGHVYANFIGKDEPSRRHADAYEPATRTRLQQLKAEYDPDNFFRRNINIAPA